MDQPEDARSLSVALAKSEYHDTGARNRQTMAMLHHYHTVHVHTWITSASASTSLTARTVLLNITVSHNDRHGMSLLRVILVHPGRHDNFDKYTQ